MGRKRKGGWKERVGGGGGGNKIRKAYLSLNGHRHYSAPRVFMTKGKAANTCGAARSPCVSGELCSQVMFCLKTRPKTSAVLHMDGRWRHTSPGASGGNTSFTTRAPAVCHPHCNS
ncbi:hypothetical protein JOB18_034558 [Solea senegalensis]|uniref:Uncharacterized protein n=1 Tax=Solea senegalensis TaxID=28829 RepID=A0AAV6QIW1_SOLSE|nr:hypothetical protein JOB18_034558 [Solea senegalensis]